MFHSTLSQTTRHTKSWWHYLLEYDVLHLSFWIHLLQCEELNTTSNQSQNNNYWYVSLLHSTTSIWQDIHSLKFQCNHLIMTLLHHFSHQTCSIYCLTIIGLGIVPDNQYQRFFSPCTAWSLFNSNKVYPFLNDYYMTSKELSDKEI